MNIILALLYAVVTPHQQATQAATKILENGGSAVDAAIAATFVLNVVRPDVTGIGGGGILLHYDADEVILYEGAPKGVDDSFFLDDEGEPIEKNRRSLGGKAVAVPSILKVLEKAHLEKGKMSWDLLFQDALSLLKKKDPLANTFQLIAKEGSQVFYEGPIGREIVNKIQNSFINPGILSYDDLANCEIIKRKPELLDHHSYQIYSSEKVKVAPSESHLFSLDFVAHFCHENSKLPLESATICIIDNQEAVILCSTIGKKFGSQLRACGFYLNNLIAEESPVCPTLVLEQGKIKLVLGSSYIPQILSGVLDFNLTLQEALNSPHFGRFDDTFLLESETFITKLMKPLKLLGYKVKTAKLNSENIGIQLSNEAFEIALDARI